MDVHVSVTETQIRGLVQREHNHADKMSASADASPSLVRYGRHLPCPNSLLGLKRIGMHDLNHSHRRATTLQQLME